MKKYELTYLVPSELSDADIQKMEVKIGSFITDNKGEVTNVKSDPARRDLGVEIDKRKSARMNSIFFTLDPSHIAGLEKLLKENEGIMRHILVNKPDIKADRKRGESRFELEKKPSEKVELKEIDKKIEEILSE